MISFVIPAHDEERLLGATLSAVTSAAAGLTEPWEIVVVDDASHDRTGEIALHHGARVVRVEHRHIAATRNAGARAARGERLVFVDADTLVTGAVVEAASHAFDQGCAGGGAHVRFDGRLPAYAAPMLVALSWLMRHGRLAAGCFLFCTRAAFERAGGFDESVFVAEEIFLSRALGRQGRFVVVEETVVSSGRKLRAYTPAEVGRILAALGVRGLAGVRTREGLDLWYGPRREDPEEPSAEDRLRRA